MKTIGLIGGLSWQSPLEYYRRINEEVHKRLGKLHSARILLFSPDVEEIHELMREDNWMSVEARMAVIAKILDKAGVDMILLCTNTLHKVAHAIENSGTVPFFHIVDAAGEAIREKGLKTVGLLGTRCTLEDGFYAEHLERHYGVKVCVPPKEDRKVLDSIIFHEFTRGPGMEDSRTKIKTMMEGLVIEGAEGIVLGSTELSPFADTKDPSIPFFDSATLHAVKAVERALAE